MADQGSIPFTELLNFISDNTIATIEHITEEVDLCNLHIHLQYYLNGIETGTYIKRNFQLGFLLGKIRNPDVDVDDICRIIKCAMQIQSNDTECTKLIEEISNVQKNPICLRTLKIMSTLLETKCTPDTNLLNTYLNHTFNGPYEYKYFVSNILPQFLHKDITLLDLVWRKCCAAKSLILLSSTLSYSVFLSSKTWINILKFDTFWELLANELVINEGFAYKVAMYLFQTSLDVLRSQDDLCVSNMYINDVMLQSNDKSFEHFCILLDVAREKQLHLIEPSLHLLLEVNLPPVWLNIIYNKLLCHPHNAVAHRAALYFLNSYSLLSCPASIEFISLFTALNKNDDSKMSKQVFKALQYFSEQLTQIDYECFMRQSLAVIWNPVAFYNFYKSTLNRVLDLSIILELIQKCKGLPNKYIRQGLMLLIFTRIKDFIEADVSIADYMNIIVELMLDEAYYKYATKIINLSMLTVPQAFINELQGCLQDSTIANIGTKVDLLIEITERKNVPSELVKCLYQDFKDRKYSTIVLDRLSYLYLIKATDLQDYLMERLDSIEESHSIRQMDKPGYELVSKSVSILTSQKSLNQHLLAFEILFYMTKSNITEVYTHWFQKILVEKQQIAPSLALNFVNLLVKIPNNFGRQNFARLLYVYEGFFNCQSDEVLVRIYRNFDFILENITTKHLAFLETACNKIFYLKARDDSENAIRYLVRSIALNYNVIDKDVLTFLLRKLYSATQNENCYELIIYYSTMYFKYLSFDIKLFPMYEFLLYPNTILNKTERAEYDVCTKIYLDLHAPSPYFRWAEIRKWTLEDVMFDQIESKVCHTVDYLLEYLHKTSEKRYFPDSTLHLHKLRTWQILTFMLPSIELYAPLRATLLDNLLTALIHENHQPSVRVLMQYLLIQLFRLEQSTQDILFNALSTTDRTQGIINLLPVLYGLDLIKNNAEFSYKMLETVLIWTMGPNFKLRYYAQKLVREICHKHQHNFRFKKYEVIFQAVDASIQATTVKDDRDDFNVIHAIIVKRPWKDPKKLLYFLTVYIPETFNVANSEWEYFKIKYFWTKYSSENLTFQECESYQFITDIANDNIQKKIVPWQESLELHTDGKVKDRKKGSLIVVTSLIDSPANLGGLARTCEIFGGCVFVVDSIKVVEKKEFSNLSMTSEKWLNIMEVKSERLPEYLTKCKSKDYTILGVEQTSDSSSLENYQFQEKTVLLLGNERTGIPAPLIGLLDGCLEIPQFGVVRSLNVHVAGALVIWEYIKQQKVNHQSK